MNSRNWSLPPVWKLQPARSAKVRIQKRCYLHSVLELLFLTPFLLLIRQEVVVVPVFHEDKIFFRSEERIIAAPVF